MYFDNRRDEKNLFNLVKAIVKEKPLAIFDVNDLDDLIEVATNVISYGDMQEFCKEVGIDNEWYDDNFDYDDKFGEYYAKR